LSDRRLVANPVYPAVDPVAEVNGVNVELTDDQREFIKRAIESGRLTCEEDAVQEALALWEERERRRLEVIAMVEEAEASLARGEGIEITEESMKALAEDVKQRGRRRIAAGRGSV
jgi:Arc/MetJ-type ribon-helix-helix transcriptional regulator